MRYGSISVALIAINVAQNEIGTFPIVVALLASDISLTLAVV